MNPLTPRETLVELIGLLEAVLRDRALFDAIRTIAREGKDLREPEDLQLVAEDDPRMRLCDPPAGDCACAQPYVADVLADTWDGSCGRCGGYAAPRLVRDPIPDAAELEAKVEADELERYMDELQSEEGY